MSKIVLQCLGLAAWVLLAACHKDDPTIINGTVVDAKLGLPIQGVTIYGSVYDENLSLGTLSKQSDINGNFTIELPPNQRFVLINVLKTGYVPKFSFDTSYKLGEINNLEVKLSPRDATLRIIYENAQSLERSIYLQAQSKSFTQEYDQLPYIITQPYPFKCKPNQADTIDYPFTSDEQINLYWGFSYYEKVVQAPFRDSLYLSRGDTAIYRITF